MNKIITGGLLAVLAALVTAFGILLAGAVSFAADEPHSEATLKLIGWARDRAIDKASSNIKVPQDLADSERIRRGAGNYDAMCADCHLTPNDEDSEIRKGLYPIPPNLSVASTATDSDRIDARRFWIIKHGIKGSGMAAWSKGGTDDESIWNLVAFLRQLPQLSKPAYTELVAHSEGHSHSGMAHDTHGNMPDVSAADNSAPTEESRSQHQHSENHTHAGHSH